MRTKWMTPGLDLGIVRDIAETHHLASTEPEDVTYAEVDADGVPALWAIPAGTDPDRALPHFHFGGSATASMHADRKAAGHIAKAAGIRSLVVDFRHAPEHPYPAQLDDAETAYRLRPFRLQGRSGRDGGRRPVARAVRGCGCGGARPGRDGADPAGLSLGAAP
ncbi:alpha/beta hydrolase fold domain-containing protein [Streptomyces sp. NPDC006655]|uniref:alpha/beta hydrolase fold domain-containing protein n=1 Tax=Streptomyces sp. NPDC006655 TaxID=3156898 RepID=UPI003453AEBA